MRAWSRGAALAVVALGAGCHREVEMKPLVERTIYTTDRFYDVQAVDNDRAIVVGYGGKILTTGNGGNSWDIRPSGTDLALLSVHMADANSGWIVGQDGLVLHTADGGKTWQQQDAGARFQELDGTEKPAYLFSVHALDANHAWAVGDRSMLVSTTDGGKTWSARKVPMELDDSGGESLAASDPIFYSVQFTDRDHGWIVGEFGKIMHTSDGGVTWHEQERTLLDGTGIFDLLDLPSTFGVRMSSAQAGIAFGLEGHIARTRDGGATWKYDTMEVGDVPMLDPLFDGVEFADGSAWAIGAAGEVMRREPGATSWKRAKIGQDVLTWLRAISFSDQQHGWIVGGFGLIFRTTDGGKTWLPSQG